MIPAILSRVKDAIVTTVGRGVSAVFSTLARAAGFLSDKAAKLSRRSSGWGMPYVKRVELVSAISHMVGAGLSIAGLVVLVVRAARRATAWHVVSFSLFGTFMTLLYTMSTLYHMFPRGSLVRSVFQKFDHISIFFQIAGTYTPACLVVLRGLMGWTLFGAIWTMAVLGTIFKAFWVKSPKWLNAAMYVGMGWTCLAAIIPLQRALTKAGFLWLLSGGILYTVGAVFYGFGKQYDQVTSRVFHDVFHIFVLGGSACHFWFMNAHVMNAGRKGLAQTAVKLLAP